MDERQMREIVSRVAAVCWQQLGAEIPLAFPVEVSARHVHLTREAVERLFGPGATLTPKRELSQPGQFLCEERVSLVTEKGTMQRVAVLGPERGAVQVELSATDCKALGIDAPLRLSGDLRDAGDGRIRVVVGMATCGIAAGAKHRAKANDDIDNRVYDISGRNGICSHQTGNEDTVDHRINRSEYHHNDSRKCKTK